MVPGQLLAQRKDENLACSSEKCQECLCSHKDCQESRVYVRLQITHVKKIAMRKATTATMSRAPMSRKTWDGVAGFPPLHLTNWHERTEPQQTHKNPTPRKETHKNPVPAMRSYVYLTSEPRCFRKHTFSLSFAASNESTLSAAEGNRN